MIFALALGIGANSAMFSVINGVLLQPLPYPQPGQLVDVWETNLKRNLPQFPVAAANYYDWRAQNQVFETMGAYQQNIFNLSVGDREPERYTGAICDRGFFDTLAITPLLGRVFNESEEPLGRDSVVVLSYSTWMQRFGGDRGILGQTLSLNGRQRVVLGVMPAGFDFPNHSAMWAPPAMDGAAKARRDLHRFRVIARLKAGVPLERAHSSFQTIGARLAAQYPDMNQDAGIVVHSMREDAIGALRPALLVLSGAVVFVLLIACANAANLLLARAAGRQREIAIRNSLGAGRGRLARQMLCEALLLSLTGGLAGLALAGPGLHTLLALAPANYPRLTEVSLDWRAVAFTLAVSLVTGILFGLAPAWPASRANLHALLKEGSRGAGSRNRLRHTLVIVQAAAAVILLAGAGLLMRSFYVVTHVDAGFDPDHVLTMQYAPSVARYRDHDDLQIQLARGFLGAVSELPGVQTAALTTDLPLAGNPIYIMRFEGRPAVTPSQAPITNYFAVTPGYRDAMGMRLLRGRWISDTDVAGTTPVVVVNQTLVDRYFPHEDPLGKRLEITFDDPPNWRTIVGVVADIHTNGLDQDTPVQTYTSYFQEPDILGLRPLTVLARTARDPAPLAGAMKAALLKVDRSQPIYGVHPMTAIVAQSIAERRFSLVLLAFFAGTALFLAAVGLYGVMAYAVQQRTAEIGIRMALGARQSQVLFLVERQGMTLVLTGVAIGLAGGLALTRLMGALLFQVSPRDPWILIGGAAALVLASLVACYLPARRASRVDPLIALRYE